MKLTEIANRLGIRGNPTERDAVAYAISILLRYVTPEQRIYVPAFDPASKAATEAFKPAFREQEGGMAEWIGNDVVDGVDLLHIVRSSQDAAAYVRDMLRFNLFRNYPLTDQAAYIVSLYLGDDAPKSKRKRQAPTKHALNLLVSGAAHVISRELQLPFAACRRTKLEPGYPPPRCAATLAIAASVGCRLTNNTLATDLKNIEEFSVRAKEFLGSVPHVWANANSKLAAPEPRDYIVRSFLNAAVMERALSWLKKPLPYSNSDAAPHD